MIIASPILNAGTTRKVSSVTGAVISTTIFTTFRDLAVPRTLYLEKREGTGKIFLDTTETLFYPKWQSHARTVFSFVSTFLASDFSYDFTVSVTSRAVDGWSTSVPLFLLAVSAVTGEELPRNIFSTGCMFSPDGWVSHGKYESVQRKIDALNKFVEYKSVEDPHFLIPFSHYAYTSENVSLHLIKSVFSALKRALPRTYQNHKSQIEELSRIEAQDSLQPALKYIPSTGDAFVLISANEKRKSYTRTESGVLPFIKEEGLSGSVYLYYIRENTVIFKHLYNNPESACAAALRYQEVLHENENP